MQIELSVHDTRSALLQAALDTVVEGAELTGVVTRMMLYHGAQVDLGTVYDGCACALLPVSGADA